MDDAQHREIARCLFQESNDALFLFDPRDHHVVDLNPVAERLTGVSRSGVATLRIWQLFSGGPSGRGIAELIGAYQKTGFFHSREGFSLIRAGGETIPVNVSVSRIHTRPSPLGLVVARDISERLQAQEQLRESERRFRGLVESAQVLIVTLTAGGTVTSVNPEFEVLSDWPRDEWLGRPFVDLLHPEDRRRASECFERALEEGSSPLFGARLATNYAGYRDIEVLSLSRLVQGRTVGLSLIARDVTRIRRAEAALQHAEELRRSRELAEVANRVKSEFLAQISHEIRNPLAAILSYNDLLAGHPHTASAPEDYRADLEVIRRNGGHLRDLIDELLDLSRIEMGKLRVVEEPCDPGQLIADVVSTLRPQAEAAGCAISVVLDAPPEPLRTDPARLRQILLNLLGNAIHHAAGSAIRVGASLREPGAAGRRWAFEVSDSGPGLAPEDLARIFEPFQRGPLAEARQIAGAGLGLTISRRLAERLGGRLTADSTSGRGCTFTLELSAAAPTAPTAADRSPTEPTPGVEAADRGNARGGPDLQGLRILLAEDSEANRHVIALRLERAGARATAVGDGRSALAEAVGAHEAGNPFDVLLVDLQLPGMDGLEVACRVREAGCTTPLIALTAHATPEDRASCLERGFTDVITKPIDWEGLLQALRERVPCPVR